MKPTPQQEAFIAACQEPGSIALDSCAGSGKTSTLTLGAKVLRGSGMSTSYSKSTAEDLGRAMPPNFPARTMHSAGLKAIMTLFGISSQNNVRKAINEGNNKIYNFLKSATEDMDDGWRLIAPTIKLVEIAQTYGIQPNHHRFLTEDTEENWEALADQYDLDLDPFILDLARRAIIHSTAEAFSSHTVSFNEMLTLPLFFPMKVEQFPTIIVDELQDLNLIQHRLLARMLRAGGRVIGAGDPSQAIFAFRGAMSNSYSEFIQAFNAREMRLSVSFRCPKAVVREAQRFVPHIEAAENAIEGSVTTHEEISIHDLPRTIICRNNAPITRLALRLIIAGHSAQVAGKDIGAGLKSLTKRIDSRRDSDKTKSGEFTDRLLRWQEKEVQRKPHSKGKIADKVETLLALSEHHGTLGDLRKHLDQLFVTDKDAKAEFQLLTVHRSKGKEWDEVAILDPHLMPSKWAKQEWEVAQERNLQYVAVTRAKRALHYITTDSIGA